METFIALLLNIIYGFIFILAFGVMTLTAGVFLMAAWSTVARLFRRAGQEAE